MSLGEKIYEYRNAAGRTQQEIADELRVSVQSVSQWENGQSQPDVSRLVPLAKALETTVGRLLEENKVPKEHRKSTPPSSRECRAFLMTWRKVEPLDQQHVMNIESDHHWERGLHREVPLRPT